MALKRRDTLNKHKNSSYTPDNVYVDIKIPNLTQTTKNVLMTFEQQKDNPIIDNPSHYYLSLVRWKVPGGNFPVLIMPIVDGQADPNLSVYTVTLETSTDTFQKNLYYYDRSFDTAPGGDPLNANPNQKVSSYYFIYEYQHLLDMVNQALYAAWDNVTGKPVGSEPPFMIFNPVTKIFSLVAQLSQYGVEINALPLTNPANPPSYDADIKIFFNVALQELFTGFAIKYFDNATLGRDAQVLVANYQNNYWPVPSVVSDYVEVSQQFSSAAQWSPVKQILFSTNSIPIQSEFTATSGSSYKKILTDFEPLADTPFSDARTTLQYYPQGPYRLLDLTGTNPLYKIDLYVTWLDIDGNEYYATVPPDDVFTAKLLFVKRDLYKNQYLE